jgi:hypothetical protein
VPAPVAGNALAFVGVLILFSQRSAAEPVEPIGQHDLPEQLAIDRQATCVEQDALENRQVALEQILIANDRRIDGQPRFLDPARCRVRAN